MKLFIATLAACFLVQHALGSEWQTLFNGRDLSGWKATPFAGAGDIEVKEGALVLNQGILTGINLERTMPKVDYEVELEAKRVLGTDFFCGLTFPVQESFCTLIVGGWGGAVVGLSSIDDEDAAHNETTKYIRFTQDRWYRIRVRVTAGHIDAWIDNDQVIHANITGRKISLRPGEIEQSKPFGLATWSTTAHVRDIRVRTLGELPSGNMPTTQAACLRLLAAATNSPVGWQRLATLCDTFGSRLSGSTNLEAAIDWILSRMRDDGFENVRGEPVQVPAWVRGAESVQLLEPRNEPLPMLGLGGSIATPPEGITAPVLVVRSFEELRQRADEAKGRIVVFATPFTEYGDSVRFRVNGAIEAAKAGAVASLIRSTTDFGLRTPHTGAMFYQDGVARIPHAALPVEDANRLARWQAEGRKITLRLHMSAATKEDRMSRNVVGEIRGREKPEEIIVVGGHIDSWDVGHGAQDDGGGCVAAWEALRLMKELGLRPRRTVRCVLWTNEENGGRGARAYRDAHAEELSRHVVAIETDSGTFQPRGFGFTGSDAGFAELKAPASWLQSGLGAGNITRGGGGADVGPLLERGVPVMGLDVERSHYLWYHHTHADTVDHVAPKDLQACTAALAVMVYSIADSERGIPRSSP